MASKIDSKSQNSEQTVNKNKDSLMPTSSSIHTDNRFGRKSRSMFFIRHTAHPKNLRFITGSKIMNKTHKPFNHFEYILIRGWWYSSLCNERRLL